jgi:hypothetical protein
MMSYVKAVLVAAVLLVGYSVAAHSEHVIVVPDRHRHYHEYHRPAHVYHVPPHYRHV